MKRRLKPKNFGAVECYSCGDIVDIGNATQRNISINVGHSGPSITTGKNFLGTLTGHIKGPLDIRVNSGRQYFRNKTVWVCNECSDLDRKDYWRKVKLVFLLCVVSFVVTVYLFYIKV